MIKKLVLLTLLTVAITVISFFVLLDRHIKQIITLPEQVLFTVNSGMSIGSFSKAMVNKKWISNRFWLRSYARLYPEKAKLKVGTYQFVPGMTLEDILAMVVAGKEHQFAITFIEGTTLKQWLLQLANQPHLNHQLIDKQPAEIAKLFAIASNNPEGWFFPDTYSYTAGTSDYSLLKWAHRKMKIHLEQAWQERAVNLPYDDAYQALIMASIIEKESGQTAELRLISSVFVNRLRKKMRLQTDPTVIYGLGERYNGDIKRKHLREKTLYNTYVIKGLPPTPIAMPGLAALQAVLQPENTDYLYFVSKGNGSHVFSTNLAAHNAAVARYQLGRNK